MRRRIPSLCEDELGSESEADQEMDDVDEGDDEEASPSSPPVRKPGRRLTSKVAFKSDTSKLLQSIQDDEQKGTRSDSDSEGNTAAQLFPGGYKRSIFFRLYSSHYRKCFGSLPFLTW